MDFTSRLKSEFNKWRIALLVFIIIYASCLLLDLGYMSIQWDEIPHLYGGLFLIRGQPREYMTLWGYYPPLYDLMTAGYFTILGASAASGRLVAVTFALLSIWGVFEFTNRMYGPKIALISSILLGIMPGFFWVSRIALLETILIFFFSLTMFLFYSWICTFQNKTLILSGVFLGVGFLARYQIVVAGVIMLATILLLFRDKLRATLTKFWRVPVVATAIVVPWLVALYTLEPFGELLRVMLVVEENRALYSTRYPLPIFYLIEATWPYNDIHPISLPLYILGLLGLGLFAWRRKTEDKLLLTWFFVVYLFFTLMPNKQWRYVITIFPVLAISAASFIVFIYSKAKQAWKSSHISLNRKRLSKVFAGFLIVFTAASIAYSCTDGWRWVAKDYVHIPIDEAASYAAEHLSNNESVIVLCISNLFNNSTVKFHLEAKDPKQIQVWNYPELPIDAFTPHFDVNELIALCEEHDVRYVFLSDYGGIPYFNSTLTSREVHEILCYDDRFTDETSFGVYPHRTFVISFS